jgi:hypothetical protein
MADIAQAHSSPMAPRSAPLGHAADRLRELFDQGERLGALVTVGYPRACGSLPDVRPESERPAGDPFEGDPPGRLVFEQEDRRRDKDSRDDGPESPLTVAVNTCLGIKGIPYLRPLLESASTVRCRCPRPRGSPGPLIVLAAARPRWRRSGPRRCEAPLGPRGIRPSPHRPVRSGSHTPSWCGQQSRSG